MADDPDILEEARSEYQEGKTVFGLQGDRVDELAFMFFEKQSRVDFSSMESIKEKIRNGEAMLFGMKVEVNGA